MSKERINALFQQIEETRSTPERVSSWAANEGWLPNAVAAYGSKVECSLRDCYLCAR